MNDLGGEIQHVPDLKPIKPGTIGGVLQQEVMNREPNKEIKWEPLIDDLIVFGQGPVIDSKTLNKPKAGEADIDQVTINSWARTLARATGELYKAGVCRHIILSGGRSGGKDYPSEAQLMEKILVEEYGIVDSNIDSLAEKTPANLAYADNIRNQARVKDPDKHKTIGVLGSDFQLGRIRALCDLFDMEYKTAFSAEEVLRAVGHLTEDQKLLDVIDQRLNQDDDLSHANTRIDWKQFNKLTTEEQRDQQSKSAMKAATYYEEKKGEEGWGIKRRGIMQGIWQEGDMNLEDPRSWVGFVGLFEDEGKIRKILAKIPAKSLAQLGLDPQLPIEKLRKELELYRGEKRILPSSWDKYAKSNDPEFLRGDTVTKKLLK